MMVHRVGTVGPNLHLEDRIDALTGNPLDGNANRSQIFNKSTIVNRYVNELAYPLDRKFHLLELRITTRRASAL